MNKFKAPLIAILVFLAVGAGMLIGTHAERINNAFKVLTGKEVFELVDKPTVSESVVEEPTTAVVEEAPLPSEDMLTKVKATIEPVKSTQQKVDDVLAAVTSASPQVMTPQDVANGIENPNLKDEDRYGYAGHRHTNDWFHELLKNKALNKMVTGFHGGSVSKAYVKDVYIDNEYSDPSLSSYVFLVNANGLKSKVVVYLDQNEVPIAAGVFANK